MSQRHEDISADSLVKDVAVRLATRRFKEWGEVVELIHRNNLTEDFAAQLDASVRTAYKQCFDQATDPLYGEHSRP